MVCVHACAQGNLLLNPGFEDYTVDAITNWTEVRYHPLFVLDVDADAPHSGSRCLKLDWLTNNETRTSFTIDQKVVNDTNKQYRLSLWVRRTDAEQYFKVDFRAFEDPEEAYVFRSAVWWQTDETADATNWQEWTCENVMFCEDASYIGLAPYFGRGQGTVWLDDASLTEMEDETFPLTDLSQYDPPANHPVLWDPGPARAAISEDGDAALVEDAAGTLLPLSEIREFVDDHVFAYPDWTSGYTNEIGTVNHYATAYWVRHISHLYVLTGESQYFDKAREELLAWVNRFGEGGTNVTARVTHSALAEQKFVLWMAEAFDNIHEGLNAADRQDIEVDFLRPSLTRMVREFGGTSNISVRQTCVAAMMGLIFQDSFLLKKTFHSFGGIDYVLRYNVGSNGGWLGDASSGYVDYTFGMLKDLIKRSWHAGLNLYEVPEMVKFITFLPRILFPDGSDPTYGDGSWELWEDGWGPYETFKELEPELAEFEYKSELFADLGYAVLREGEGTAHVALGFTYGLMAGHAHSDRLGLILYGNDQLLAPDAGTVNYTSELYFPYIQKAVSHNLVVVDEMSFKKGGKRNLWFSALAPLVKVISASTDDHYPGVLLHRTLVLTHGYVLDLFRCQSDEFHRYDWIHNNFGDLTTDPSLGRWSGPLGFTGGYVYIDGTGSARTQDKWSATCATAHNRALRLLMAGGPTTEVIAGQSPRGEPDPEIPAVFARRRATNTVYVATLDPYQAQPKVESLAELRASSGRDSGVGAAVSWTNGTDYFALSCAEGSHEFIDRATNSVLDLDGDFGAVSWEGSDLKYVLLVEGASLYCGGVTVTSGPATTVYAEMVSSSLLRVENMGATQATVYVGLDGDSHTQSLDVAESFDMAVTSSGTAPTVAAGNWPTDPAEPPGSPPVGGPITFGVNLASNPSMETAVGEEPEAWEPFDQYPGTYWWGNEVYYDGTNARTGTYSLKMAAADGYDEHTYPAAWVQESLVDNGSNTVFQSSAWVMASEPTKARLCLYGYEPGWGRIADDAVSPLVCIGTNWTQITHTTTFGAGVTDVNLLLIRPAQWQGGEVWFDDVVVTAVDPATLAPEVENVAPSDIAWTTATLNGDLVSTGGAPVHVWIYWGTNNASTNKESWQTNDYVVTVGEGGFSNEVQTLTPGTPYYYRCYASNVNGAVWAPDFTEFSTPETNAYTWTGNADQSTWTNAGNWSPSDDFPGDADDKATIPSGLAHSISTDVALAIGELDMASDCTATITLGAPLTISTNNGRNGKITVSGGEFACAGHELTVAGEVHVVEGTLDAHTGGDTNVTLGSLRIGADGTYQATAGTTTLNSRPADNYVYKNEGAFRHNNGTMRFVGLPSGYIYIGGNPTGTYGVNAFYNLVLGKGTEGVTWVRFLAGHVDVEHDLMKDPATVGKGVVWLTTDYQTLTLGTTNYASQVTVEYMYGHQNQEQYI